MIPIIDSADGIRQSRRGLWTAVPSEGLNAAERDAMSLAGRELGRAEIRLFSLLIRKRWSQE